MITQAQINQFQAISPNALPAYMMPNYETIKEMLAITTDANDLNELGVGEDFDVFFTAYKKTVTAPKMTTSSTAVKTAPAKPAAQKQAKPAGSTAQKDSLAEKQTKARASAKTPTNSLSKERQKQNEKRVLEISVADKYTLVKQNARFKNNIGEELTRYLKENVVRLGLGGLPIDYEIEQLKAKDKFYTNLLKNDKEDFKAIAKRLGLTFKAVANSATPSAYRKKDEKGKPLPAQKAVKSSPDNRTAKQKENDAWNWLK